MFLLTKGDRGPRVKLLQKELKAHGFDPGPIDGDFGPLTLAAVIDFQARHSDARRIPLVVDGEVGALTWWAIQYDDGECSVSVGESGLIVEGTQFGKAVARAARMELNGGIREIPWGSNTGPGIREYLGVCYITGPAQWCQAFAWWCSIVGAKSSGRLATIAGFESRYRRPSASTCTTARWAKSAANALFFTARDVQTGRRTLRAGDMYYTALKWQVWRGHVGLVESYHAGYIKGIEGNSANQVRRRRHRLPTLAGFVRLT
jgi:peptidoglycan hydrolase-like protein with peptidoglycan-binding domain